MENIKNIKPEFDAMEVILHADCFCNFPNLSNSPRFDIHKMKKNNSLNLKVLFSKQFFMFISLC